MMENEQEQTKQMIYALVTTIAKLREENEKLKKEVLRVCDERDDPGYMK
tara:strand:+ start:286 stop:432 length:147 start_codon:yes stop_codon:yes gene_type:complete